MKVGLSRAGAFYRPVSIVCVKLITTRLRLIWPPSLVGDSACFYASWPLCVW